jgi:hypothetical protein
VAAINGCNGKSMVAIFATGCHGKTLIATENNDFYESQWLLWSHWLLLKVSGCYDSQWLL